MKKVQAPSFKLFGIFGFPLGHTLSPVMQEAAFRAAGIKAFYLPFEVRPAAFRRLLKNRKRLLLDGFNVTVPYKEIALRNLDGVSPDAKAIGAVNTAVRKGKDWVGFNTDGEGFAAALERDKKFSLRGKQILVLGAGGSARAVIYASAKQGAQTIFIANRTVSKAKRIIWDFKGAFPFVEFVGAALVAARNEKSRRAGTRPAPTDIDLVVNATSVGLKSTDLPLINPGIFPRRTLFVDLIYNPAETPLLKQARRSGHQTMNGLGMLVYQGAEAFRLWTGRRPPVEVMRHACRQAGKALKNAR